ncbi:GNAT family N-acetyltransferase [Oceanobacillus bengalensis]|uniref:N-acetyltransferase n=1 Tax=Oceanobacillus bengalensis TaxID=1435466 RepID=A0A494Z558_9BACI|nr:GNAT family N-acetyltransferase [Oceanobacillus bengalensis]RKQ17144.1 N-acetyltransferase [Oceanobacillus bengalensis]
MLETTSCILTFVQQTDYENVRLLYINEKVRKYLGGVIEEKGIIIRFNKMMQPTRNAFYFTVKEKGTDAFVGLVSFDTHHDGNSTELSFQFLPDYWGMGYATEVCNAMIAFAFNKLQINTLVAETQTANIASCRLLEKIGMELQENVVRFGAEQAIYRLIKEVDT